MKLERIAPKHAAILACKPPERLSNQQKILLERIAANCPTFQSVRALALDFRDAITSKDRDGKVHWVGVATQSGIGPLIRFAYGLRKDFQAVFAAVETPWNNGRTEIPFTTGSDTGHPEYEAYNTGISEHWKTAKPILMR